MEFNKLVFTADFSKDGKPDPNQFVHQIGSHKWGNREEQYYTDELENCYIKDGVLNIVSLKKEINDTKYTSARLTTHSKHSWTYGKIEVTAILPKGHGSWPAIWMLPDSIREHGWPKCGEIDIMEHVGRAQDTIHFSLHSNKLNHKLKTQKTHFLHIDQVSNKYHKYGMIWDDQKFQFFIDDKMYAEFKKEKTDTFDEWPFDQPFHLILNTAVGGAWGGPVDEKMLPFIFKISKIEVFQ